MHRTRGRPTGRSSIRVKYAIAYTRTRFSIGPTTGNHAGYGGLAPVRVANSGGTRLIALSRHYRCSSRINDSEMTATILSSAGLHAALGQLVCLSRDRDAVEPKEVKQTLSVRSSLEDD